MRFSDSGGWELFGFMANGDKPLKMAYEFLFDIKLPNSVLYILEFTISSDNQVSETISPLKPSNVMNCP